MVFYFSHLFVPATLRGHFIEKKTWRETSKRTIQVHLALYETKSVLDSIYSVCVCMYMCACMRVCACVKASQRGVHFAFIRWDHVAAGWQG